jgi:serine/threonine protein kinase
MSTEPITDSPDARLQAALAEYLERIDRGDAIDREAFLAEYPDLAAELAPLLETGDALKQIGGNRTPEVSTHSRLSSNVETTAPGRQSQEAISSAPLPADFGRYRVIKPLGQGAMGIVYLAEDTHLHRQVAIKTSSFDNDHSGELLERFYREARSAANLRHPNICPVYDVGEIEGRHYISLAYIEGRTVATYVNTSGSLHERQVLVLIRKLALALEEAHKHEVVHRDLKPANIMVDPRGEPIIMDFGLARVGYSEDESRLTQVGMIVGSPAYMSPERVVPVSP